MASPSPPVECVVAEHSEALPTDPTESADATAELHSEYGFIPEKAQSEKFEHREAGLDHADDRQPEKELPLPSPFPAPNFLQRSVVWHNQCSMFSNFPGAWVSLAISSILFVLFWVYKLGFGEDLETPVEFFIPIPDCCEPGWVGHGEWALDDEGEEGQHMSERAQSVIRCSCPADGRVFGDINPKSVDAVDRLVRRAKNAQPEWAKTTFSQRRKVLKTLLKYILDHQDAIIAIACLDSGKTQADAVLGEVMMTAEKIKWTIDHGENALKAERRPTNLLMTYKVNEVRWEPLGVVAACVSWNYPFHNFMGPIISAIFTGNSIVVKPSEQTAWSSNWFLDIAKGAVAQCGHSHNIIQSAPCYPTSADRLTSHPDIAHITFIGSRTVAHKVCASAAKSLTPVCVELGGKDPALLLDDIRPKDLKPISSILMRGVFTSAGQNCIGFERIIACPKVYDSLVSIVEPRIRALRVGSAIFPGVYVGSDEDDTNDTKGGKERDADDSRNTGKAPMHQNSGKPIRHQSEAEVRSNEPFVYPEVDVGAMISSRTFPRLEELIDDAVKNGARLLVGGKTFKHPDFPLGHYFQPTLLVDVTPEMKIAQEELFAPIFLVMRASSTENAIEIANSTIYGLGASVFGTSKAELEKVVAGVKSGMVAVNDFAAYYAVQLPFGGVKGSGYGRFAGKEGLRSLSNTKAVCWDRWPWIASTRIPPALDYPIKAIEGSWNFAMGIVEMAYGETWRRRVGGVRRIIKNM